MILRFKTPEVFRGFLVGLDPNLIQLLFWIYETYGTVPTITSAYRKGDSGVHGTIPLRGIDLRSWEIQAKDVERKINRLAKYDPQRPTKQCAILHDTGNGMHLHLQVHPNTTIGG